MDLHKLETSRKKFLNKYYPYKMYHWKSYNYEILNNVFYKKRVGRGNNQSYNDCIIMADTETSKKHVNAAYYDENGKLKYVPVENHVVAWTISIRFFHENRCTLYGHKPTSMMECIRRIRENMHGHDTFIYFHNLAYDYVFLRKFLFEAFGHPDKELNIKPHVPIYLQWDDGLILRDSYVLAQRSLDKWAEDMCTEHQKAVGKWDYSKIRSQHEIFTHNEMEYIEHDTLVGCECIDALLMQLKKNISTIPYTATGIPRGEVKKRAKAYKAHDDFLRLCLSYEQYRKFEYVFHGGFTHCNRYYINETIKGSITCFDFSSSYPYCMLAYKYPMEKFTPYESGTCTVDEILSQSDEYAYVFKLILMHPEIKDYYDPMPALQYSKVLKCINPIIDNGRIIEADYAEIYLNEIDLQTIAKRYKWTAACCTEVEEAFKDYLPRWYTDYVYNCYKDKTMLKGSPDKVSYTLKKSVVNSLYGMSVQKSIKDDLQEDFDTGEYNPVDVPPEEQYQKYLDNRGSVLAFQWGTYVTSYAMRNLFSLGACAGTWLYSDTDSCYGMDWDMDKVNTYNEHCKELIQANGYEAVIHNGREYWLGIAELDGTYTEFRMQGAKRYCDRSADDNKLHLTVAGVPKKAVEVLNNDINNFTTGLVFPGTQSGKQTHSYFYIDEIYTDENGNLTGDSIDLTPCDYLLDTIDMVTLDELFSEEVNIQVYE